MGHQNVGRSLLSVARSSIQLNPYDPVTQCLAPRIVRTFATQTDLPIAQLAASVRNLKPTPPVSPHLLTPPTVLTPIHSWPSLEPSRFVYYPSSHLNAPLRRDLLHRAIIFEGDSHRKGTASTKHRTQVHGSNRKLAPQKGRGMARVGDKKSPSRVGGGVAHGPSPRDFSTELQRKVYDQAWRIALSHRFRKGELIILEDTVELPDTVTCARFLHNFFVENKFGAGNGRTTILGSMLEERMIDAMKDVGEHGIYKDIYDVDVKDLLETGRIIIEKPMLDTLLMVHSNDLGLGNRSLDYAVDRNDPKWWSTLGFGVEDPEYRYKGWEGRKKNMWGENLRAKRLKSSMKRVESQQ